MSVQRLAQIPGFSIDRVAAAAGDDPDVLRLENLDTDIPPPAEAIAATRAAIGEDEANSWLPFTGREDLKEAVAAFIERRGGPRYDGRQEIVIVPGEGVAMLDALFSVTDPGDEVILTDPTYAGMINRVRLVGAVPRLVPLRVVDGRWRLDTTELRSAVTDRTRAIFVNNASFPSGWVASQEEWEAIADVARSRDLWLVYWASFEGVLFDGREVIHPASLPGMRDRTVTVGDVIAEQRMIGWRIGWVAAPGDLASDVARAHIYSGLLASGFAQIGARVALQRPPEDLAAANAEWQRRRDETMRQLEGLPAVAAAGGWSLLLDVAALGFDCLDASDRLLDQKVAATPMRGWGGPVADRHVRFVFSNEPVDRLALMGERVRRALSGNARLSPSDVRFGHQGQVNGEDVMTGRWSDLSERNRKLIVGAGIAEGILKIAVLIDIRHRPANQIRGSKRLWIIAAVLVNSAGIGPLSYFAFGRRRDAEGAEGEAR